MKIIREFITYVSNNKYSLWVLCLLTFTYLMNQFDRYLYSVAQIPFINYDSYKYGLLAGPLFTVVYTVAGVMLSFIRNMNRVKILTIAIGFWSIMTTLVGFSTSYWQVALLRIGLGVGEAACTPFATSLIADYFPYELRGISIGIYNLGIYIGYGLTLGIGTFIHDKLGWQWCYLIAGFVGMGITLLIYFTIKEPKITTSNEENIQLNNSINDMNSPLISSNNKHIIINYWLKSATLILLCLAGGTRNAAGYVWGNYSAIYFSSLFVSNDDNKNCHFSYNENYNSHQICDSDYPYCVGGECKKLNADPWHNEGMSHLQFISFMSWIPIVGGSLGAILGGVLTDSYVKKKGLISRLIIIIISNITAAPFAAMTLSFDYPYCFFSLFATYVFGEMWIGVIIVCIIDIVPHNIRVASVAIYMFIITNIGGNAPILVPFVQKHYKRQHNYHFNAYSMNISQPENTIDQFIVQQKSSYDLQKALMWLYPGVYIISAIIFIMLLLYLRYNNILIASYDSVNNSNDDNNNNSNNNNVNKSRKIFIQNNQIDDDCEEEGNDQFNSTINLYQNDSQNPSNFLNNTNRIYRNTNDTFDEEDFTTVSLNSSRATFLPSQNASTSETYSISDNETSKKVIINKN